MKILRLFTLLLCFPFSAIAQNDDKGVLTKLLEDSLTGAGRVVVITGFEGALSSEASMQKMTIADDDGIWLILEDVILDWSRLALLRGRVEVEKLTAKNLTVLRKPLLQDDGLPKAEAGAFSLPELPVSVNIDEFAVETITLGAPILGEEVQLNVTAQISLADGSGEANIKAKRIDAKQGQFNIQAKFDNATTDLNVNIDLSEGADGIAATLLNIPDRPSVALTLQGKGPLDAFTSEFTLKTAGEPRLAGDITLSGDPTTQSRRFNADIKGDVTALFAPKYRDFFGPEVVLKAKGTRYRSGALDLEEFMLRSQSLNLKGIAKLDQESWPSFLDITGSVKDSSGSPVLLPLSGAETRVNEIDLTLRHDRSVGDDIRAVIEVAALDRDEIQIEKLRTALIGQISQTAGKVAGLTARVGLSASGVTLQNTAANEALGSILQGGFDLNYAKGTPIQITDFDLNGPDYSAKGEATIGSLNSGLETDLDVHLSAKNLARFSTIANQPLDGAADLTIDGMITVLSGAFDLDVTGGLDDLTLQQAQVDTLMRGRTALRVKAKRNEMGTLIESANITNKALNLQASAQLGSDASQVSYDLTLNDTSLVAKGINGPLSVTGTARGIKNSWSIDTKANGPYGVSATIAGQVTGTNPNLRYTARLPNIGTFVPQINGPLSVEGTAQQQSNVWRLRTNAQGPGNTNAQIVGIVENGGNLDLRVNGTAQLGLANPFLSPRNIQGTGRFDLTVQGPPALSSVRGSVNTNGARLSLPSLSIALQDIVGAINLNQGRANITIQGAVSSGGQVRVDGPVTLSGAFPANLSLKVQDVTLIDPNLFKTSANGQLTINGPLTGGAKIAGKIDVGETKITVPSTALTTFGSIPNITHIGAPAPVQRTIKRAGLGSGTKPTTSKGGPSFPLNITISAPNHIFVRGRGLDAELGGNLRLSGTTQNVISTGRFELIRGRLDILQQRFQLNEGIIQLQGGFVPFIRFVATTQTQTGTASIIITGPASEPSVSFQATPEAPEDEVLSQLLFGRDISQMSAFQALQLANAVATLAGRGGEGIVGKLRKSFGLDDFDISTDEDGNTGVRAGKYISDNAYTDVTIGSDGSADVSINLDLTPNLTAKGSLGSDGNTSIGIYFQKDY